MENPYEAPPDVFFDPDDAPDQRSPEGIIRRWVRWLCGIVSVSLSVLLLLYFGFIVVMIVSEGLPRGPITPPVAAILISLIGVFSVGWGVLGAGLLARRTQLGWSGCAIVSLSAIAYFAIGVSVT